MIKLFLASLMDYFNIKEEHISLLIQYRKFNENLEKEWGNYLNLNNKKILTRFSKRHKEETAQLQINGVVFRKIFELVIKKFLDSDFIQDKELRRGFLRGLFAAEGNIGIDYLEKKPYISQISFNLNIKEENIERLIKDILKRENINYKIRDRIDNNSKEITISNWKNYKKLWEIKLFDICKRKKEKFQKIMHNLSVYCSLEKEYTIKLIENQNLSQREIAKLIGSWQGQISKIKDGKHLLTIKQFNILNKKINESDPINKIKKIRIGNLTFFENNNENKEFITCLLESLR